MSVIYFLIAIAQAIALWRMIGLYHSSHKKSYALWAVVVVIGEGIDIIRPTLSSGKNTVSTKSTATSFRIPRILMTCPAHSAILKD